MSCGSPTHGTRVNWTDFFGTASIALGSKYVGEWKDSKFHGKGTCNNYLTMRLDRLEEAVLQGLQEHLLTKDLTDVFAREYTLEINRQKDETSAKHNEASQKLITIDKQITNILEAIVTG